MEAISPLTSKSEQKSIEENIVSHFASLATFIGSVGHMFFKSKGRVKVRLNPQQFRWIFLNWFKSKAKKKKKKEKKEI